LKYEISENFKKTSPKLVDIERVVHVAMASAKLTAWNSH